MRFPRLLPVALALFLVGQSLAETPQERARAVTVTMTLNDVPPGAAAHFVEIVTNVKVHFTGRPGDQTLLTLNFENATAHDALSYIAEMAKLELSYQADGAYFRPKK